MMSRRIPGLLRWFSISLFVTAVSIGPLRAELHFDRTLIDAGLVYTGTRLAGSFSFVNDGASTVEIREVRASCGCLTPRLSQRTYSPGARGTIALEVNTFSQADGLQTWALQLGFRDGERLQEQTLELRARLITEVRVQPAALVIVADREGSQALTITDLRAEPLKIKQAQSSLDGISVTVAPLERAAHKHWLYRAMVHVAGDLANGRHDGLIEFVTDDPRYDMLRVPITVIKRYQQRLAATPAEVSLTAPPGQPFPSRLVLIRDQEGQKVKIDRVTADDPAVHCRWADGPEQLSTVKIHADRAGIGGELQTIVHVQLSQPLPAALLIPVHCVAH